MNEIPEFSGYSSVCSSDTHVNKSTFTMLTHPPNFYEINLEHDKATSSESRPGLFVSCDCKPVTQHVLETFSQTTNKMSEE